MEVESLSNSEAHRANTSARSWTLVGNLDSPERIGVDRRGLVSVQRGSWSLDWWLRVDEDWIFPSQHGAVRQRLVQGAPVVETVLRVAGGDIVHRVYATRKSSEVLVVEVENQATRPVALAWAVRPYDDLGGGRIDQVELKGDSLYVNGRLGLVSAREPGRMIGGSEGLDPASSLDDENASPNLVSCTQGMASAAVILPLVHGTTLSSYIPLGNALDTPLSGAVPSSAEVVRGWTSHASTASRLVLPAGKIDDLFDASKKSLLLTSTGIDVVPGYGAPPHSGVDEADLFRALVDCGYSSFVREIVIARAKNQDALGAVYHGELDVTSATIIGAGRLLEVSPDPAFTKGIAEFVADGARWILANEDSNARVGLRAAMLILEKAGAHRAAGELAQLIPAAPEAHELDANIDSPIDAVALSRSASELMSVEPAKAFDLLQELIALASPTMNWPSIVDPESKWGTGGAGNDLRVTARFVMALLRMLVDDSSEDLRLGLVWPKEWLGQGVEVHGVPSRFGSVSWAVRWHGDRPALLWEAEDAPDDVLVRIPGLDENFAGLGKSGEELLSPVLVEIPDTNNAVGGEEREEPTSGSFT